MFLWLCLLLLLWLFGCTLASAGSLSAACCLDREGEELVGLVAQWTGLSTLVGPQTHTLGLSPAGSNNTLFFSLSERPYFPPNL